jgi:outer membrane protein
MKKLSIAIAAITAGMMGVSAQAYEAGNMIGRVGLAKVSPQDDSSVLKISGVGGVAGTGVEVDDNTQLGLTGTYMLSPSFGIELLAATPFEHDISVNGLGGLGVPNGTKLGSTKHLPPTLSAQWYPLGSGSALQPYLGVGVNYTTFFSEKLTSGAKTALGASNLKLDDSFGLAFEAGLDWAISSNWVINASVWKADIDTTATVNTALGKVKVDVEIDPMVYMLAVGYKF